MIWMVPWVAGCEGPMETTTASFSSSGPKAGAMGLGSSGIEAAPAPVRTGTSGCSLPIG
jgi:hypothetical protein